MKVIAFLGSPRVGGNTEILLNEALKPIKEQGHEATVFRPSEMNIAPCINCGGCDNSGVCVFDDDMEDVYRMIREGDRFIVASPIFFFGLTAQIKALIDRCQALWCEKYLLNRPLPVGPLGRKGLLLLVGGMKKEKGFVSSEATATAFLRTISVPEHQTLAYPGVDAKGAINQHPTALHDVYDAGNRLIELT
jgi:multimeric flavodoxin WrbA